MFAILYFQINEDVIRFESVKAAHEWIKSRFQTDNNDVSLFT